MARKSNDLDKKLLSAGTRLLLKQGISGLSVREVAKKAKVNLGMFSYHFQTKEQFIKKILEQLYEPFIQELASLNEQNAPLEKILFNMARFSRDNSSLIFILVRDALEKDSATVEFIEKNFTQHFEILNEAIKNHFATLNLTSSQMDEIQNEHLSRFVISSIGLPNLLLHAQQQLKPRGKQTTDSDEILKRRVRATLTGLEILSAKDS